jgi:hypothetical protein
MSFREKSAWISLLANLAIYGFYFVTLASALGRGDAGRTEFFGLFVGCFVALIVVTIALTVANAVLSPKDATAPEDEREKLISMKSRAFGYFVLASAIVMAAGAAYFGTSGFLLANGLFFALVLGEVLQSGVQIFHYRRGV